ncbi:MAG TPA: phage major capsid protein [Phycisphaerae bacterium]|nr:phage major capsid protein [Phycisphaerae bacterium]
MEKLVNLLTQLAGEYAKGGARDEAVLASHFQAASAFLATDEARGYAGTPELTKQLAQLRADIDAMATRQSKLEKLGLRAENNRIVVMNHDEVTSLLKVGKVFRYADHAEGFAAMACRQLFGQTPRYNELVAARTREMAEAMAKDMDPAVSASGGALVANMYMADLITAMEAVGVLFTQCDRVPLVTTGSTDWPKLTGELTAYPTAAMATIEKSAPTFGTVPLRPVKWAVRVPVPNEFFKNPTLLTALGQRLGLWIVRAIAYAFDNCIVNGDGTAAYGNIDGLLHDTDISAITPAAHTTLVTYDGTDVGAVIAGMAKDYVTDPYWMMSLSAERTLRNLKSTVGTPLYERGSNGEPNTIDGYPYKICQRFPAAAAATAAVPWGAFGDLRLAYLFGEMGGIELATSEHVQFNEDMTVLRGIAYAHAALKDADAVVRCVCHA